MDEAKIKCDSCDKNKLLRFYSKTALKTFQDQQRQRGQRQYVRSSKQIVKAIKCMACSGGNREELPCARCGQVLALDRFNKTQRRKGDDALCQDCSQEKQDLEPEFQDELDEIDIIKEIIEKESTNGLMSQTLSTTYGTQRSQTTRTADFQDTDTNPDSQSWKNGNDAVSLASSGSSPPLSYKSNNTRPITGTAWDGFDGIKRTTATYSGSNTGFVKQNAVPKPAIDKARAQHERNKRREEDQDEVIRAASDEDSDDGEYAY